MNKKKWTLKEKWQTKFCFLIGSLFIPWVLYKSISMDAGVPMMYLKWLLVQPVKSTELFIWVTSQWLSWYGSWKYPSQIRLMMECYCTILSITHHSTFQGSRPRSNLLRWFSVFWMSWIWSWFAMYYGFSEWKRTFIRELPLCFLHSQWLCGSFNFWTSRRDWPPYF